MLRPKVTESASGGDTLHGKDGTDHMERQLHFPDVARSDLERNVADLVQHAHAVLRTQGRLRSLLSANRRIVEHLDLADTLHAVVETAVELVSARSGLLTVSSAIGGTERSVHAGEDRPLDLAEDRGRQITVPIRVRDTVYGTLRLDGTAEAEFTDEDQELAGALAATAGVAIDNAQLFEHVRLREQWTTTTSEVTAALLADDDASDVLAMVVDRVGAFVDSELVSIVEPVGDSEIVRVTAASGRRADDVRGRQYSAVGTLAGDAMTTQRAVSSDLSGSPTVAEWQPGLGPTIAIPLRAFGGALGALIASRAPGGAPFTASELDMAADFGRQTSVVLAVARSRHDRSALDRAEERSRIARDLHDHAVQRLFGTGLALQSIARAGPAPLRERLEEQVTNIDEAISEIRTAIFALGAIERPRADSVRDRVLTTVASIATALTVQPSVTFSGPVDLDVHGQLADDLIAVVRESVTNIARHAPGSSSQVRIATAGGTLTVLVSDDGPGPFPGATTRRSGIANLTTRADRRGGTCSVTTSDRGGTDVRWTVPLPTSHGSELES
ncbi:GAF domain-containing protein [Curtobacterium sp. VKM Ac-1393]|nr:GAF domain-containing protein [Curtobacterium sp. VKM Ac-1393]